jgi:hypothetical protein
VPIKTLFDYLENDYSLDEFLECFPSVTKEAARAVLEPSVHNGPAEGVGWSEKWRFTGPGGE